MANVVLTTSANFDSTLFSPLNNGENISVNGVTLTINNDVRWGLQGRVIGNQDISGALGGIVHHDGSTVWEIPFTGGTGTVPARWAADSLSPVITS